MEGGLVEGEKEGGRSSREERRVVRYQEETEAPVVCPSVGGRECRERGIGRRERSPEQVPDLTVAPARRKAGRREEKKEQEQEPVG